MLAIEPATRDDIPELVELLTLLFAQEAEFVANHAAQVAGLNLIFDNDQTGCILLAKSDGKIKGMVTLLFVVSTAMGKPVALLEDVIVRPEYRSQNVGSALVDKAIAVCKLRGCARITLLSDADNAAAHRFYNRCGFTKSTMIPFRLMI